MAKITVTSIIFRLHNNFFLIFKVKVIENLILIAEIHGIFGRFWAIFKAFFFWNIKMISAHPLLHRYMRYISAILVGPLRVTAELIEILQYSQ